MIKTNFEGAYKIIDVLIFPIVVHYVLRFYMHKILNFI